MDGILKRQDKMELNNERKKIIEYLEFMLIKCQWMMSAQTKLDSIKISIETLINDINAGNYE